MKKIIFLIFIGLLCWETSNVYGQSCNNWNYNEKCGNTTRCCCVEVFSGSCCDYCHCDGSCSSEGLAVFPTQTAVPQKYNRQELLIYKFFHQKTQALTTNHL